MTFLIFGLKVRFFLRIPIGKTKKSADSRVWLIAIKDFANFTKHFSKDFKHDVPTMFDGTGGRMGRGDGLDGLDGPEKSPLNFFILCEYIDYVYVYLYKK